MSHDLKPRLDISGAAPEVFRAMSTLSEFSDASGLEHSLLELVKMRASQINGCAFCLHMHTCDALEQGETTLRLTLLDAWRESSLYTPRERAALAWTEALTRLADTQAPDADYAELAAHFSADEQMKLTLAINVINAWNRFCVGFRVLHP